MHPPVNFPTFLTLIRLILSPLVLPLLLVYFLPFNIVWINALLAVLFILFGITDFFDGYLARKRKQVTPLGRVLDPLADKFLVYSTLIALLTVNKIYFYWVVLLIGRELFVVGLRQMALEHAQQACPPESQCRGVPVSWLGKCKTVVQLAYLAVAIFNPYQGQGLRGVCAPWNAAEGLLLAVTLFLSLFSAYRYAMEYVKSLYKPEVPQA